MASTPLRWRLKSPASQYCLLNCWFRRRSKKTAKLRVTGLRVGNSPVAGEFPVQRANNAENVSSWWRNNAPHCKNNNGNTFCLLIWVGINEQVFNGAYHHALNRWPIIFVKVSGTRHALLKPTVVVLSRVELIMPPRQAFRVVFAQRRRWIRFVIYQNGGSGILIDKAQWDRSRHENCEAIGSMWKRGKGDSSQIYMKAPRGKLLKFDMKTKCHDCQTQ